MQTPSNTARYILGLSNGSADAGQQLSREYEQAAGLKGIAASYKFPDGLSATRYDHWASSFCGFRDGDGALETDFLQETWDELVALNPELNRVNTHGKAFHLRHGIFGAASLFNPDDIEFYIEVHRRCGSAPVALLVHNLPVYRALHDHITARTGVETLWVASPETLLKIHDQVKDKPARHSVREVFAHVAAEKIITPGQLAAARAYIEPVIRRGGFAP